MREIKLRAWDNEQGAWLDDVEEFTLRALNDLNIDIEQYTGLKDKNGKEIYEGDILRFPHWDSGWDETAFAVKFEGGAFWPFGTGDWEPDEENVEIIGNIHENPGLLT